MNKISRLLLLFLLTILTVFAVSACTKKKDNQDNKTTMTEEPGIPLETYLNGNFTNMPLKAKKDRKKITLKPSKHPQKTVNISNFIYFGANQTQKFKKGNLDIYKYQTVKDVTDEVPYSIMHVAVKSTIGMWNGIDVKYTLSYYKDGKNIYKKTVQEGIPVGNSYLQEYDAPIRRIMKFDTPGTYVFHVHHIIHTVAHWDAEEKITYFKDHVFAFQIGDGDDVG